MIEKGLVLTLKSLVKKAAVGWIFCLALMWMMAAACAAAVSTPVPKADRNSFKIVKVRSTGVVISMSLGEIKSGDAVYPVYAETEVVCKGKRVGYTAGNTSYAYAVCKIKKNRVYYYRIRPFYTGPNGNVYGEWTAFRAICTMKVSVTKNTALRSVVMKVPKMSGVKEFTVYMSTKRESDFRKVLKGAPGKSKKFRKFRKKRFKVYKNYYYRTEAVLLDGVPCQCIYSGYFWFKG